MDEVNSIGSAIQKGNTKPVYFLMGEEPYFIDQIADYIEASVLQEDEKGFNQMVLYGRDVSVDEIVGNAKRFPMMSNYQVIIVREAQHLKESEKLVEYIENPLKSTILVIAYKHKSIDKRTKLYKAIKDKGIVFDAQKLWENQ